MALKARADRARALVAVPGGRHRAGRRGVHQGPADVGGGLRRRRSACTRSRSGTIRSRRSCWPARRAARRSARRSATTSTCATSKAAARCCSPRPRTTTPPAPSARSCACSTRRSASTTCARAEVRLDVDGAGPVPRRGRERDGPDQPRPARPGRRHLRTGASVPGRLHAVPRHHVRADRGPARTGPGLHPRGRATWCGSPRTSSARWSTTVDHLRPSAPPWTFGAARADALARRPRPSSDTNGAPDMADFNGLGLNLGNLSRLSNAKSRSISPENFTGEKGKGGMSTDGPAAQMRARPGAGLEGLAVRDHPARRHLHAGRHRGPGRDPADLDDAGARQAGATPSCASTGTARSSRRSSARPATSSPAAGRSTPRCRRWRSA